MPDILAFIQNHWALSLVFLLILLALIAIEFVRMKSGTRKLSPQQVIHLINRQNAIIVDIRSKELYQAGHIAGAMSIPFSEFKQKQKKLATFKTQPIIIVCSNGLESHRAVTLLTSQGLSPMILVGGVRGWQETDLPLVKD